MNSINSQLTPKKTLVQWLQDYAQNHQHPFNQRIHKICVPLILWSLLALFSCLPYGPLLVLILCLGSFCFYWSLAPLYAWAMLGVFALIGGSFYLWSWMPHSYPLCSSARVIFILAWLGQFWGHHVEGRRPSFLQDLAFLLIGPLWVLQELTPIGKAGSTGKKAD